MGNGKVANWVFPKKGSLFAVGDKNAHRLIPLASATLTIVGSFIAYQLTSTLNNKQSWGIVLAWMAAGIIVTYLLSRMQLRSQEVSSEAIKERLGQLEPELRKQVQARSYGTRRNLIEAPLRELDLDITPRVGWVRDHRLVEPEPFSDRIADDIVAAFESSKRRLLLGGEPGSGKTMAAYSLIEYLDETEGAEGRIPLLVNLSAWEAQETFEAFLVDYLCSSVGYEVPERAVARAFISSDRYDLILDGLDEIPVSLRAHFSERLDEFVRGLAGEVGVVVTCRTQEYEQLLAARFTGLGLVQAVQILPLSSEQRIANERAQDEALQGYLDGMSELLTDKEQPLHRAQPGDSLSTVARARTLMVLGRLDGGRKGSVMRFLLESQLIGPERTLLDESGLMERRHIIVLHRRPIRPVR